MMHFHFHIASKFSGIVIQWLYSQDYNSIKLNQTSQVPTFQKAAGDDPVIHATAKQPVCTQKVEKCQQIPVVIVTKLELQAGWNATVMQKNDMWENEMMWLNQNNFLLCVCLHT